MPTFPSNPTITSRLSTGSALTYTQMDTNFGNLTASIDSIISVSRTASYVDSSNVYSTGTSQSFWSASISSSTVGTATISTLNVTNLTAAGTVTLNGGLNVAAGAVNGNVTGSLFGTSSFASTASYVVTAQTASYIPTLQQVVTRGTYASSSTSVIFAATDNVQVRGEAGNSDGNATLAFGVGTNTYNYITAGKNLVVVGNTGNSAGAFGVTIQAKTGSNYESAIVVGSGSAGQSRIALQTGDGAAKTTQFEVLNELIYMYNLPTTEPSVTGSLWLSGSGVGAASGSKYLMVFNG